MQQTENDAKCLINNREARETAKALLERSQMEPKLAFEYSFNVLSISAHHGGFRMVLVCFPRSLDNKEKSRLEGLFEDAFRRFEEAP